MELLESDPDEDCDLALPDSSNDNKENGTGGRKTKPKKNKKKTRKVQSIENSLGMSDDSSVNATTFNHFHGEGDSNYIEWTILKEGEEITMDIMQHQPQDGSLFATEIEWHLQTYWVDYFKVFSNTSFHHWKAKPLSFTSTCPTHNAQGTLHIGYRTRYGSITLINLIPISM